MPLKTYDSVMAEATSASDFDLQRSNESDSCPESILVAASPEKLSEATLIPTNILENSLHFKFTERLWAPTTFLNATTKQREIYANSNATGLAYDSFMLVNMGAFGYGLMSRKNFSKGDYLFHYAGEFISQNASQSRNSAYQMGIKDALFGMKYDDNFDAMNPPLFYDFRCDGIIDAKHFRNFSAFAQHAPEPYELSSRPDAWANYIIENDVILNSIATTNAISSRQDYYVDGMASQQFCAAIDIPAYTMINITYGKRYWLAQQRHPELFTKSGERVDYHLYYPSELYLEKTKTEKTALVFSAILNMKGLNDLSYEELRELTRQHLGEERFRGHLDCFLRKNNYVNNASSSAHLGFSLFKEKPAEIAESVPDHLSPRGVNA
jgi:hypothetical protein